MKSEKSKMVAGELYDASDAQLLADRQRARTLCQSLGTLPADAAEAAAQILDALFGSASEPSVTPPFFCDYGYNIHLGHRVYFNFDCVVLDVAPVRIGSHTLFGPGVHIYTATHPLSAAERRSGLEWARPVSIGSDVWVGGASVICPGVSIGDGSVIGAGSVVTKDVPAGVVAAGNPCRVLRRLEQP